ncbi:hypothetical protein QUF70_14295 [Desulfobacterales bacterium HSG17]|nr:hypothetical protein [Desulfobacterales bacterium HSG17]
MISISYSISILESAIIFISPKETEADAIRLNFRRTIDKKSKAKNWEEGRVLGWNKRKASTEKNPNCSSYQDCVEKGLIGKKKKRTVVESTEANEENIEGTESTEKRTRGGRYGYHRYKKINQASESERRDTPKQKWTFTRQMEQHMRKRNYGPSPHWKRRGYRPSIRTTVEEEEVEETTVESTEAE